MRRPGLRCFVLTALLALLAYAQAGRAQEILLIEGNTPAGDRASEVPVSAVADFLGLSVRAISTGASPAPSLSGPPLAIIIDAEALPALGETLRALDLSRKPIPVLIRNVDSTSTGGALRRWSAGTIDGCSTRPATASKIHLAAMPALNGPLSGMDLPAVSAPVCILQAATRGNGRLSDGTVISSRENSGSAPILVRVSGEGNREIFLAPRLRSLDNSWMGKPSSVAEAFSAVAPLLVFLKHVGGEYGWHLEGRYANFTLDDPWLTEPYGNLSYRSLLGQMQQHHFHTTIAFIPWNYDRSEPSVAALFRANPHYFSVCLHGNDHAHREFGSYTGNPLPGQMENIRQGVARMEALHRLSGVAYDRFMVFPHGVAPEATFAALRRYGFLGTANSLDVPLDATFPSDPLFLLRPWTDRYAAFLSLSRYSVEAPLPAADLPIQAFLGNPILLYGHEAALHDGGRQMLADIDTVNRLAPGTEWLGLGDMARQLYQIRQRPDGDFDVRMFSNAMLLRNPSGRVATFHIAARAGALDETLRATVNAAAVDFHRAGEVQSLELRLAPGETQSIRLAAPGEAEIAHTRVHRGSARVYLLRRISDVRDRYLSVHGWGRALVGSYYQHDGESVESKAEHFWLVFVGLFALIIAAISRGAILAQRRRKADLQPAGTVS